ncbi:MAG: hypothetical protein U5K30_00615 [Acidimicrobiales bacterium]|nr:hypothetical protein [Acidimicrobiales bacterium]
MTAIRAFVAAGVLAAACGSWALCHRCSRRTAAAAFWLTLAGSPLLFDAQLLIAHGPAAALGAALFVSLDRWRGPPVWIAVAFSVVVGSLLRSEFVLLGVAVAAIYGGRGILRKQFEDLVTGGVAGAAALSTYLLEPRWIEAVAGRSGGPQVVSSASRPQGFGEFVDSAERTLFDTMTMAYELPSTMILAITVCLGVVALLLVRFGGDPALAIVPAGFAVAGAVVLLAGPTVASGLVVGFPMVLFLVLRRSSGDTALPPWNGWVIVLFACAVLATQYSIVGGFEWGWRYFAIAVPGVTPYLAVRLANTWDRAKRPAQIALAGVVVAFVLVPIGGLREARRLASEMEHMQYQADELVARQDIDYFVSVSPVFGLFAYKLSLDGRLVLIDTSLADELLGEIRSTGAARLMLIWRSRREPDTRSRWLRAVGIRDRHCPRLPGA